jgi:hypothetical protein
MCTPLSLKCLLFNETVRSNNSNDSSIYSNYYKKTTEPSKFNQIQIKFKNKFKLLTGIEENTTFNDLKMAILISLEANLNKSKKYLLKKAKEFVILQSVNNVEKIISSTTNVQSELKQLNREAMLLQDEFKIFYIMRSKKSLHVLKPPNDDDDHDVASTSTNTKSKSTTTKKYILPELIPDNYSFMINMNVNKSVEKTMDVDSPLVKISNNLDCAIDKLDVYIQERKSYIKLLENYLELLDSIEQDEKMNSSYEQEHKKLIAQNLNRLAISPTTNVDNTDAESVDTGFNSISSSTRSSISSINGDNSNTFINSKQYVQNIRYISRYETYV